MRKILALAVLAALGNPAVAEHRIVAPEGSDLGLPFSPGVISGDFLYLSGAIGNKPGTLELADGIEAQVHRTMNNLSVVLEAAGMDLSRVVSTNVYLSDARHFPAMNAVYETYFGQAPPTRATVEAEIAIPGALVEIAMVAARPGVERRVVEPVNMKSPKLPYSWGIMAGDTLFVAGATSRDPATYEPVEGDVATQTRRVFGNIGAVLKGGGLDYGNVVSCRVFLEDARHFQEMNAVYREFFPAPPPARATVRARLMNPRFKVEIQCIASKDPSRKAVAAAGLARSSSPFSPAIQVGSRLYLAGMVGRGPDGFAPGDVAAQTRQTLLNLEATLKAAGMTFDDVVDATVYLSDIRSYQAMNEVYGSTLPKPPPARATVGSPLMSPSALVEIMMVAER